MDKPATITLDGREVLANGERNLLELARAHGIDIPSFCYHSSLSTYGACRLCLVEVEGMGIVTSCSTAPRDGLVVRTNTPEIRRMRKIALELILAGHEQNCPQCPKSASCRLQELARRLGVDEVRFKPTFKPRPVDRSSLALVRNPNKCILCGDCVRACREVQGIGAIDFAHRGGKVEVACAFGKDLGEVECVNCGLCASVCPTGALTPATCIDEVLAEIDKPEKVVVAQIAPAVRVALGEHFGKAPGDIATAQITAALKMMGFDKVFDTCFAADLTVIEEAEEFIARKKAGEKLPQFTSCCPGWVKFAEQYYPDLLENLSTCRSPQQMFGSLAKKILPEQLGVARENLVVVSIMPCTAKKFEAAREEFADEHGQLDVDYVLTTQELGLMIERAGTQFENLEPASLDMPLGFKTGAGVLFGTTGGVTEAVLRYAAEALGGGRLDTLEFNEVRGQQELREASVTVGGITIKLAIVHSLRNARAMAESIRRGECDYDLIEVMACPGGCVGGAGQPVSIDPEIRTKRAGGLYSLDRQLQLHRSQDNPMLAEVYTTHLGEPGGHTAHELLHTGYRNRRRTDDEDVSLLGAPADAPERPVVVQVCVGTNCHVRGSQELLNDLTHLVTESNLAGVVDVRAAFCLENCGRGPNVKVNGQLIEYAELETVKAAVLAAATNAGAAKA